MVPPRARPRTAVQPAEDLLRKRITAIDAGLGRPVPALDPLRLHVCRLADEVYELAGSWGADETATITDPFDVTIELATLLP